MRDSFAVQREIQFDAGHRVPRDDSKCQNPHGHRYKVVATIVGSLQAEGTAEEGMVINFSKVKQLMTERIHDVLDHAFIIHEHDEDLLHLFHNHGWRHIIVPFSPTAEELARWCFQQLADDINVVQVAVWETPNCVAYYPA